MLKFNAQNTSHSIFAILGRITTIAKNVFREVIRDRILYIIGLFAVTMILAIPWLREVSIITTNKKIMVDLGLGLMTILGVIVAIFVGTGLVNKEIEKRTVLVLIAKPVSYAEFIIGKHLGLSAVLAVLVGAMTTIYLVILSLNQVQYPLVSILLTTLYLFFELSLLTAVALLFGIFTSSVLAIVLSLGIYIMGHLSGDVIQLAEKADNVVIERLTTALYLILPDLSRLDLKNQAVYGVLPHPSDLGANAVYALIYIVLILAIATFIFSKKQF